MAFPHMPSICNLPFSPVYERYKTFAFDFMFVLAREYRIDWTPYGRPYYFIDPLSPMTSDLEEALRILLRNSDASFMDKFEKLVPSGTVAHSRIFVAHSKPLLQLCLDRGSGPDELFQSMAYVGRLSIIFYQRGVRDAPNFAVVEIGETLRHYMYHYGPGIFPSFRVFAQRVILQDQNSANV